MALSENNQPMCYNKSEPAGFAERIKTLCRCVPNVDVIAIHKQARSKEPRKTKVADDDILDAIALAITAKLGSENGNRLGRLPKGLSPEKFLKTSNTDLTPTDCKNLPMEMVYAFRRDTGAATRSEK